MEYKNIHEQIALTDEQKRLISKSLKEMIRKETSKEINPQSVRGGKIAGLYQALRFINGELND